MSQPHRPFSHVVVVGPGAIGLTLAVRLSAASDAPRLTVVDHRTDRAARLAAEPVVLETPDGELGVGLDVRTAPEDPPDLVLLATKAPAARAAAVAASDWIGGAPLVTLQNGLGVADAVREALPETQVLTAVSYQAANVVAEGRVRHVANLATYVGQEGQATDAVAEGVAELLHEAGLPAETRPDMRPVVWAKLLVNAGINPVAALAGERNGAIADRLTLQAAATAIVEEGAAVAEAEGVEPEGGDPVRRTLEAARATAENRCSMLQDLEAGRETEIEFLNGAIVRLGETHGISVPTNRAVTALVRQVSGPRTRESHGDTG